MFSIDGFLNRNKADQKKEGDPIAASAFAARLAELERGAAERDIEMAANALALKYGQGKVSDEQIIEMYRERVAVRPDTQDDRAKIEATLDRH